MKRVPPILADLVFLGGGHAQIAAIKSFAMNPVPGLRLTIVTANIRTPYSGMLPAYVEGVWDDDDLHIDLAHLAQFAGARLIIAPCTGIDADGHKLLFDDRPPLHFDILSINIGGQPDLGAIEGAADQVIPVKPIAEFQKAFDDLLAAGLPKKLAVIGGGAAGCELVLALNKRWRNHGASPEMTLYSRSTRLMPQMAPRASHLMFGALLDAGIKLQLGRAVDKINAGTIRFGDNTSEAFDACFLVSAVRPPRWLSTTGIALDDQGFIAVHPTLQSKSHDNIFAAGDVATISGSPRPRAGVFAVRAGPVLAKNLRKYLHGHALKRWSAQRRYLAIIGTADNGAIASWGQFGVKANGLLALKYWIDRRFMAKYQQLTMPTPPAPQPFAGLDAGLDVGLGSGPNGGSTQRHRDPVFATMRCLGCAAKASHNVLANSLEDAIGLAVSNGADPALMPEAGIETDAAIMVSPPAGHQLVQSVDVLSEIVSDPFMLGRIAAVHALSDLYAALATPTSALAIINLPEANLSIQTNQLTQILAGGLFALSEAGVKLTGGHTSEGGALSVGFSVTGHSKQKPAATPVTTVSGDDLVLVLTKPLGTGVIMAGHMQLVAKAQWVDDAIRQMAVSNQQAAKHFLKKGVLGATDITGFGLARHAQNLSIRLGGSGCRLDLSSLRLLDGALALLSSGIRSSLHDQNRAAVQIDASGLKGDAGTQFDAHIEALFDPQTSGGLLGAFPRDVANRLVTILRKDGQVASIIGTIGFTNAGVHLTGHM
ncbi:selenide, water dikinase SelD [Candidatus Puniceispirillum sp.]|nr:selenide, water dikinase SelD [Candidatus Puniceispirillum sp.]